jgi:diguanylate cyclase (GGDEF)-like protein/PAS domain S-box-containing protein
MPSAPIPVHEEARLEAVREYDPFGAFDDAAYHGLLDLARELFGVPAAFISLVDRDEQVFPAGRGIAVCGSSRAVSFCAHAVANEEILVVLDATLDPRFADNPLVTGPPHIRFYAGVPLVSPSGHAVGTFCLLGYEPHNSFTEPQRLNLRRLADLARDKLELRRLQVAGQVGQERFENIAATSPDGIICADAFNRITFWNAAAERMFGHTAAEAVGHDLALIVPPRMRKSHQGGLIRAASGGPTRLVGHLVELMAQRADGGEFPIELSLSMWRDDGVASFGAILRDITERRASEERLFRLAHHDPLTELPNRSVLRRRVDQLADGVEPAALLVVDLDGFKAVNDDLGHAAGDMVLKQVAQRLLDCAGTTDTVARLGGDEFAVLMKGVGDQARADFVADRIIRAVAQPITVGDKTVSVGASIGIATHLAGGNDVSELLSSADLALYQAKSDGRHCHRTFTQSLRKAIDLARAYDNELTRAYEQSEFEVFYQPQMRLSDLALVGAEALLRWRHPVDGLLSPAAFMPGLENRPISTEVGQWVLQTACAQAVQWRASGAPEFRIGVNLFGSQLRADNLAGHVRQALATTSLPAGALELEVTENIFLRGDESMVGPLRALRADGVLIAFDDYGTGYTSLSMLKRFPITRLKIDKSFVQGMSENPEDAAIVRAILYLASALGFTAIAEGIETHDQADRLRDKGCEEVQGYLFGRPMSAPDFAARFGLTTLRDPAAPKPAKCGLLAGVGLDDCTKYQESAQTRNSLITV